VDDQSTDNTVAVVEQFSDARLKLLVNHHNLGAAGTRNRALREAKGKWIAILDSDDWYAQDRLEKLLAIADAENADMIADDLYFIRDGELSPWSTLIRESKELLCTTKQISSTYFVKTDMHGQQGLHLGLTKPLIRRDFLQRENIEYNSNFSGVEDYWLYLMCLINGARFILWPEPYYFYRSRPGSHLAQSKLKHINQCEKAISNLMQNELAQKVPDLLHCLNRSMKCLMQYKHYYNVVEPLKRKEFSQAAIAACENPGFLVHLIKQMPAILKRRVQYYVLHDRSVLGTFSLR
jgi:succinoglycan biosynthesis protein ExoO